MKTQNYKRYVIIFSIMTYLFGLFFGYYSTNTKTYPKSDNFEYNVVNSEIPKVEKKILFVNILKNNLQVIFLIIIGSISFGIMTFVLTVHNGFVLGYVFKIAISQFKLSEIFSVLLPHSSEIIGIIWSSYLGYILSLSIFHYCFTEKEVKINIRSVLIQLLICICIIVNLFITKN